MTDQAAPPTDDLVAAFQIEGWPVRGRIVRLGPVIDDILLFCPRCGSAEVSAPEMPALNDAATCNVCKTTWQWWRLREEVEAKIHELNARYGPDGDDGVNIH